MHREIGWIACWILLDLAWLGLIDQVVFDITEFHSIYRIFSALFFLRAYKEITEDDLKFPLVYGEGKRARVLATIGVTRGFGDHELKVHGTDIFIKPFLSPAPEVSFYTIYV